MAERPSVISQPDKPPIAECPPDTVHLFQISRGPYCPSMSPFPLKVETYLRLANIPYQNDLYGRMSPTTGKTPWIQYNDTQVSDSTLIIDFLNEKCGVDLNKGLTVAERAVCTAFERLVDEHLYWVALYIRWLTDDGFQMVKLAFGDSPMLRDVAVPKVKEVAYGQGIGRHSEETIMQFGDKALQAIQDYLGDKQFMMGDGPTQVDCSVFGLVCNLFWQCCQTGERYKNKFPKLNQYCLRMKQKVWPDWDECITHGGAKKATK